MKRIYIVTEVNGTTITAHMVKAATQAAAIRAIASPKYTAEVASPEACIELASQGVKVIEAGSDS